MNEKIKELAEQAMSTTFNKFSGVEWSAEEWRNFYDTKFALLIVRECANQCDLLLDHKISSEWARGTHDCSRAIKKHFGVEE